MQPANSLRHYIVDASVAIKWHLRDEEHVAEARAILTDFREGRVDLLAPDHINYEVAIALRVAVQRQRISVDDGQAALVDFFVCGIPTVGGQSLVLAGYEAAMRFGCAFYDGLYIALADRAQRPLVHADRRLHNTLAGRFPHEFWIEDYEPVEQQP